MGRVSTPRSPAKVVLLGDPYVGKTRLCRAIIGEIDGDAPYKPTLGADFAHTDLEGSHTGEMIRVHLWDTAGQEHFRSIIPQFMTGADLALICYDMTELNTFTALGEWVTFARGSRAGPELQFIFVGCKSDLTSVVAIEAVEKVRDDYGAVGVVFTSAKTMEGIPDLRRMIADIGITARAQAVQGHSPLAVKPAGETKGGGCSC